MESANFQCVFAIWAKILIKAKYNHAAFLVGNSQGINRSLVENFGESSNKVFFLPNPIDPVFEIFPENASVEVESSYLLSAGRLT
jgi:hypothetical protein